MDYLMINIFKAYQFVSDTNFVGCNKSSKDQYGDSEHNVAGQLMTLALEKYKISTSSDKWNSVYP